MSIGPTVPASIAGVSLAQIGAAQSERASDAGAKQMKAALELKSENAAGVGATDGEEHAANERDADGRRLWEAPLGGRKPADSGSELDAEVSDTSAAAEALQTHTDELGGEVDLSG